MNVIEKESVQNEKVIIILVRIVIYVLIVLMENVILMEHVKINRNCVLIFHILENFVMKLVILKLNIVRNVIERQIVQNVKVIIILERLSSRF